MTTCDASVGFCVWARATDEIEAASSEEARDISLGRSRDGRYLWEVDWDCCGNDSVTVEGDDERWDYRLLPPNIPHPGCLPTTARP